MIQPVITTARLVLQPIDAATASRILDGDAGSVALGAGWPSSDTVEALRLELELGGHPSCWLMLLSGTVIGEVGWKGGPSDDGVAEIGYSVAPDYRRNGYASEAVAGFARWAAGEPRILRLVAETLADNIASRRVLANAGFAISHAAQGYVYWLLVCDS